MVAAGPEGTTSIAVSSGLSVPGTDCSLSTPSVTATPLMVFTSAAFGPTTAQMSRFATSGEAIVFTTSIPNTRVPTQLPGTTVP